MGDLDPALINDLYRREYGRIVGALLRRVDAQQLGLVESATQTAFARAWATWKPGALPDNPGAWLMTVARNLLIDSLRSSARFQALAHLCEQPESESGIVVRYASELQDDALRLLFLCAHPALPPRDQLALTLQVACGFKPRQVGRALLLSNNAVYQRIHSAKRRLKEIQAAFEVPGPEELSGRLQMVLSAVYLLFNLGYTPSDQREVFVPALVVEAERLLALLAAHPVTASPAVHALHALVLLNGSRMESRLCDGELVPLTRQDRARWDQTWIGRGIAALGRASVGDACTEFHLLAGVAACHATAATPADTDWARILSLYDALCEGRDNFVYLVNRAIAVAAVHGPEFGLRALQAISAEPANDYYLLHATRAHLLSRLGRPRAASRSWHEAEIRSPTKVERSVCQRHALTFYRSDPDASDALPTGR